MVISIISLLMALMLPSLRSAREQSKQLVCRKNLTNVWRGIVVYAMEYQDRAPLIERLDPELDPFDPQYPTLVGNVLGPYVEHRSFVCPSAVSGYPETDPTKKRHWKLTYDFSTPDRFQRGGVVPYDKAEGAFTGQSPDPAVENAYHFDGRPFRLLTVKPPAPPDSEGIPAGGGQSGANSDVKAEIIWTTSRPLVADALAEDKPGDIEAGRPRYPHRGVVRRQSDVYRSLITTTSPQLITSRRPGYFHMHAEHDNPQIFLTRISPDRDLDD